VRGQEAPCHSSDAESHRKREYFRLATKQHTDTADNGSSRLAVL